MKNVLLIAHHSGTPGGPLDKFHNYLRKNHKIFIVLHPLWLNCGLSSIIQYKGRKLRFTIFPLFQYFLEGLFTLFYLRRFAKDFHKIDLAICFDGLSFFHMHLLRHPLGIKKIVFYNVDYSRIRFHNVIMNYIYKAVNVFSYKKCDYFLSITKQFIEDIDPTGMFAYKNSIVTGVVSRKSISKDVKRVNNSLVFAGSINYTVDFNPLLIVLKRLKDEKINFRLDIYGTGQSLDKMIKRIHKLKLEDKIFVKGVVENDMLVSTILPRYKIGVCPYLTKDNPSAPDHMFSGIDLTAKLVEYIAVGLPIVTTRLNDYFDVIEKNKFGYLVHSSDDWYNALKKLLSDHTLYKTYRINALKFARNYDEEKVLGPIFKKIL